jgi:FlaA1/EpsC-like NDP-sugar epimerase
MLMRAPGRPIALERMRAEEQTLPTAAAAPGRGALLWADRWLIVVDAVLVGVAYVAALLLRYDFAVPAAAWRRLPGFVALALVVYLVLHVWMGLYGAVWRQAGPPEAWKLLLSSGTATGLLAGAAALLPAHAPPLSVPLDAGALAFLLLSGARFRERVLAGRSFRAGTRAGVRVVVVGPVGAARSVVQQMRTETEAGYIPVVVVTDEQEAWQRELVGVPVVGPVEQLAAAAARHRAQEVLVVFGSNGREQVRRVLDLVRAAGLVAKTLPTLDETMGRQAGLKDIRDLSVADLLGRAQVHIDDAAVRKAISGRRVLITGAGGSIGSEIAAQVSWYGPERLVLLDHDETHLHDVVSRLRGRPAEAVLGDAREEQFVEALFADVQPHLVFHAAAHKHVPVLEAFPSEAVRTNVLATRTLVRAAVRHGTESFISISTDKAVSPSSVMGASKRLAEQVVHHLRPEGGRFCCVRFGNVLGSRGSVVPTFVRQVQEGGPVTVTHPDMERFFMTTEEAVQLVLQAAAQTQGGEVFMLDMGAPVKIVDLAERIIGLAGRDIEIVFTGLRPGEKLSEQLHSRVESVHPTSHPKLHLVRGPMPPPSVVLAGIEELAQRALARDEDRTRTLLLELARVPDEVDLEGEVLAAVRARRWGARPRSLLDPVT